MKLIFCPKCQDMLKLQRELRMCDCMSSWGQYDDNGIDATIGGEAIPIGIDNYTFSEAIRNRPMAGLGSTFEAFVIPEICNTVREEK